MSGFLILNNEKEGTSHLMWLLDNFQGVSIVSKGDYRGREPFDRHERGDMSTSDLMQCLECIYAGNTDQETLNEIYTRTADQPLGPIEVNSIPGIKMRYDPPTIQEGGPLLNAIAGIPRFGDNLAGRLNLGRHRYQRMFFSLLSRNKVVVFFAVRQDVFRWALSMYHGDGTGKAGHIQFDLANGELDRSEIPAIKVDRVRFAKLIARCRSVIFQKMQLMHRMYRAGIRVEPVYYEELCDDPRSYLRCLFNTIDHPVTDDEIASAIEKGSRYEKVHSTDVSEFVLNHEKITEEFGHSFVDFEDEYRRRFGKPSWIPED